MITAIATVVVSSAVKNVATLRASSAVLPASSASVVRSQVGRGSRSDSGSATSPITANTIGVVTRPGRCVGYRNKLHVPHDAAAAATITTPTWSLRRSPITR